MPGTMRVFQSCRSVSAVRKYTITAIEVSAAKMAMSTNAVMV